MKEIKSNNKKNKKNKNKNKNKNKKLKLIMIIAVFGVLFVWTSSVYAATTPTLVTKLNSALKNILTYMKKIATPAAGVAIATGVMIRKLSFGDEEKMVIGKRTIINAIVGYLIIQLIDLIIKFIEGIV